MTDPLESLARTIAETAHNGQVDKAGESNRRVGEYFFPGTVVDTRGPISNRVEPCESCGGLVAPATVTELGSGQRRVVWDYRAIDEHTAERCRAARAAVPAPEGDDHQEEK